MEKEHNLLESDVVTLTLDDDVEIECAIITTFNMDSTEYIALLPLDEDGGNEDGDVWIYRFIRDTTGGSDHDLQNIEDDDEYTALRISLMNGLIHRNLKALILKNNYFIL